MKVAIVSPYSWAHPGGVNNHIEGLSAALVVRGHDVTVFAPDSAVTPPGTRYVSVGRSVPVPANGSTAHLCLLPGSGARLKRRLRQEAYDVVHVHEPIVPFISTSAVMGAPGRVVGTFHAAAEGRSAQYALASAALGRVHARLDFLVAVSEPARSLASRYFPGEYEVIPNGVDTTRFAPGAPRPPGWPEGDGPVVLFVGRNEPRKGFELLLKAMPSLAREIPGLRLVVVGSGFDNEKVKAALESEARGLVTFAGRVGNEELPAYYSAADVLCSPALGGESFGVILIEANASGTPVVASDIPGYSAVVRQTGGGMLFRNGDASSLATTLGALLKDEDARMELAAAGLEGVEQFSWTRLALLLETAYSARS